jgi:RimJ/RimL family protein N-acetyltransferase
MPTTHTATHIATNTVPALPALGTPKPAWWRRQAERLVNGPAHGPSTEPWPHLAGSTRLRHVQADDSAALARFYASLGTHTLHSRFHCGLSGLSSQRIAQLSQLGLQAQRQAATPAPQRQAHALVISRGAGNCQEVLAHGSWHLDGPGRAEFALVVADQLQGRGLGTRLMRALQASAYSHGLQLLHADVLHDNHAMRAVLRRLYAQCSADPRSPELLHARLRLATATRAPEATPATRAARLAWWCPAAWASVGNSTGRLTCGN